MGNREDLLAGAKRCLYEKGYAHTTARDIAAASGVSLAAIGYHFRSKEALLNAALFEVIGDWGKELERAMAVDVPPGAAPLERFERYWARVIESFMTHRPVWAATLEIVAEIDRVPEVRQLIADGLQDGRTAWARLLQNVDAAVEGQKAQAVGSFYQALLSGVLIQWMVDPARAPSARDLSDALRTVAASVHLADEDHPAGQVGEERA
jgi:AcrR family transcriptional regulator